MIKKLFFILFIIIFHNFSLMISNKSSFCTALRCPRLYKDISLEILNRVLLQNTRIGTSKFDHSHLRLHNINPFLLKLIIFFNCSLMIQLYLNCFTGSSNITNEQHISIKLLIIFLTQFICKIIINYCNLLIFFYMERTGIY